ncbi:uncharacterized protein LOC101845912 [Aplysia californica]|uniref:Uncharacterized protein LOC101845912 n=1 Tax=Aplysia californica TaxID=6500 RepID=A0ABM1VRA2_APLCA|nr:uncharacterized protein LOC101845912 [Aplysia californica]
MEGTGFGYNVTVGGDSGEWTHTPLTTQNYNYTYDFGDLNQYQMYRAAVMMIKVAFPILVLSGTVGNTLVILVLRRGAISTDNLNFFLSALAVVDTVFLYTSALQTWLRVLWGLELLHLGTWSCKLGLFLNHLSLTLSAWLVVVIAWQRWYTCSRPFQRCCPVENTRCGHVGLALLVLVLVAANSYVLFTAELHHSEETGRSACVPSEETDLLISQVFPFVLLLLYSGLPALLLVLLNGLLAHVLYASRRSLLSHTDSARAGGRGGSVRTRYNYVTALLLALSISWLLFTLPQTVFKMVEPWPKTGEEYAMLKFLNVLFYVFIYINHSINFFLYCALTRSFRREVRRMGRRLSRWPGSVSRWCCSRRRLQALLSSTTSAGGNANAGAATHGDKHTHPRHRHPHHDYQNNSHTDSFFPLLDQQLQQQQQQRQRGDYNFRQSERSSDRILLHHGMHCGGARSEQHPNVRAQV